MAPLKHAKLLSTPRFRFYLCKLTDAKAPADIVEMCTQTFGGCIDALLNIAGIIDTFNSVDTLKDDDWNRVIAVNLTTPVKLMREVVPIMREQQ